LLPCHTFIACLTFVFPKVLWRRAHAVDTTGVLHHQPIRPSVCGILHCLLLPRPHSYDKQAVCSKDPQNCALELTPDTKGQERQSMNLSYKQPFGIWHSFSGADLANCMYFRFGAIAYGCGSTKPCLPTVSFFGYGELFMASRRQRPAS
jgi:hypothetical protein